MLLRDATLDDLDTLWRIEKDVYGNDAWGRGVLAYELTSDHRKYLIATDEQGEVLGYAGLLVLGTDGDIQTIAVARSARGSGYGRALMNALLDEAARRGATQVFLDVRADNEVAKNLYVSLGFQEIGVRPRYYQPDDVDAIVMLLKMGDRR